MGARRAFPWWLLVLGGAGALMFYLRYRKGGEDFFVDAIEEVTIGAKKLGASIAASVGAWSAKIPAALKGLFAAAALQYGIPPLLLEALAYRESRFREDIIRGALRSAAGAVGLMQIIPKWHPTLGEAGALDPARAVPYAASYLRQLFDRFRDWKLALAAYNWGPANLDTWLKTGRAAGKSWPSETQSYVDEISRHAGLD